MSRLPRLAILLLLTAHAWTVRADAVQEAEGVARAFYAAYAAGRVVDVAPLWNAEAFAAVRPALERTAQTRCMTLHDVAVAGRADADAIEVMARVTLTSWSTYPADRPRMRVLNERLMLRREASGWKIVSRRSVEDALAERLAASDEAAAVGPVPSDDWSAAELVQALCRRAVLLINQQQLDRAALLLEQARALVDAHDDAGASAVASVGSVVIRVRRGPPAEIRSLVDESLRLAERSGDPDTLARALLRAGRAAQYATGQTPAEPFERILALSDVVEDASVLAHAATQLAQMNSYAGDLRTSLQYAVLALKHAVSSGDRTAMLNAEMNLAGAYGEQNDRLPSIAHYEEAARLAEETGNAITTAFVLRHLALARKQAGEDVKPILNRALRLVADGRNAADVRVELLTSRAREYIGEGNLAAGEADLLAAWGEVPCGVVSPETVGNDVLLVLAELRWQQQRYREALALIRTTTNRSTWLQALEADSLRELGRCDEAWPVLDDALEQVEAIHGRTTGQRQEILWLNANGSIYQHLIRLQLAEGNPAEAFLTSERIRGRVLREMLARGPEGAHAPLDPATREQLAALEREVVARNLALAAAGGDERRTEALRQELVRARAALVDARARAAVARAVAPAAAPGAITGLAALQDLGDVVVLQYVIEDKRLLLFVLEQTEQGPRVTPFSIPVGRLDLSRKVAELRTALDRRDLRYARLASAMFDLLMGPARAALQSGKPIYILPEGDLWSVPFHALRMPSGRYLLETATVSYAASLETARLAHLRRRSASAAKTLLAVGNAHPFRLQPIPEAEQEARAIAALYGDDAAVLTGTRAREDAVKREAPRYDVLHIAGHGMIDDTDPMFSAIVLGSSPDRTEDGLLEAREIAAMDLQASIAVLSACDTARGLNATGEGVVGLSWALLVAGCPTAVVSQWQVNSAATRDLMVLFHRELRAGHSPADALRTAQLALRKQRQYAHPFYWAPFVVIGAR